METLNPISPFTSDLSSVSFDAFSYSETTRLNSESSDELNTPASTALGYETTFFSGENPMKGWYFRAIFCVNVTSSMTSIK